MTTPLQAAMLIKIAEHELTPLNGAAPTKAEEADTWADCIIESPIAMAFMRPFISEEKELILILDDGTTTTLDDEGIDLPVGEIFSDGDVSESWEPLFEVGADRKCEEIERVFRLWPHVSSFEVVYKYFGYLSAPGYMDCTDFVLGNTRADVAEQLLDMHYDFEEDHMDVDELGDMHWLEEVAGKVVA